MINDPIVEEVRRARDEYARQFDYDIHKMVADLRERQKRHADRLVSFPPKPPRKQRRT